MAYFFPIVILTALDRLVKLQPVQPVLQEPVQLFTVQPVSSRISVSKINESFSGSAFNTTVLPS